MSKLQMSIFILSYSKPSYITDSDAFHAPSEAHSLSDRAESMFPGVGESKEFKETTSYEFKAVVAAPCLTLERE